jgi:hypothetical protein
MALTKISRGLLNTGVSDSSDATAITIDSSENVAIGSSTANKKFNIADSAQGGDALKLEFEAFSSSDKWAIYAYDRTNSHYANMSLGQNAIWINGADANIGIGTTSPAQKLTVHGSDNNNLIMSSNSGGNSNTMRIQANNAASYIVSSAAVPLIFDVQNAEAARFDSSGKLLIGTTTSSSTSTETGLILGDGFMTCRSSAQAGIFKRTSSNGIIFIFRSTTDTRVGTIETSASSTSYNTSSDYRLKENVSYDWDATTRLKQLKPARFNWIEDETNTAVDGFLAHEVSDIVPESISGEKDAVDEDGNPDYQGIDQSKLVPLLVKTIQELEARITTLENA